MRYISDDGKVFNTEGECLDHENRLIREKEEEFRRKEELEMKRQDRIDEIWKASENLHKLVEGYKKDYGLTYLTLYQLYNKLFDYILLE